jgi:hypothetical protein
MAHAPEGEALYPGAANCTSSLTLLCPAPDQQRVPPEDASVRAGMGLTSRDDDVDPNEPETKSPKKSGTFNFTKTQVGPAPADAQTDSTSTAEDDADEMDSEFTTEIVAQVRVCQSVPSGLRV